MVEGKFVLRKDHKPNEFGEQWIYLQYCTQGAAVKKKTDIKVMPEFWLGNNMSGNYIKTGPKGHPKAELLNRKLVNLKNRYDKIIGDLLVEDNRVIPVPLLRSILNGTYMEEKERENGKVDFIQYVLDVNEEQYKIGKVGYAVWVNVQCYMNKFREFLRKVKHIHTNKDNILYCRDIDVSLIRDYIIWRKDNGNTNETINKSLSPIFKAVKRCCREGWISRETCDEIMETYLPSSGHALGTDKKVEFLSMEQLQALKEAAERARFDRTRDFVDMFLFSVYCGGLRVSDLISLKWDEIDMENRMIQHIQVKNHSRKTVRLTIPMPDGAVGILERWNGKNENYVFGMLDDEFDLGDEERFIQVKTSRTRTINQSLAALGEKIGLPFRLHIHCARHTFGTLGLNACHDIKAISTLMGHSSTVITEKVYASVLPNTLKKVVDEKLNFKI